MENASKALIMAGAILIGMLILSLGIYLFVTFGGEARKIRKDIDKNQMVQYNSQYTTYANRKNINIYEIISISNLAKQNNEDYSIYQDGYYIQILLQGESNNLQDIDNEKRQELIEKYNKVDETTGEILQYFSCTAIEFYENTGRVKKVVFEKTF